MYYDAVERVHIGVINSGARGWRKLKSETAIITIVLQKRLLTWRFNNGNWTTPPYIMFMLTGGWRVFWQNKYEPTKTVFNKSQVIISTSDLTDGRRKRTLNLLI